MAANLPIGYLTHVQRVKSIYKRAIRLTQCFYDDRLCFRYQACILRERFDRNKDIQDTKAIAKLVLAAEEELFLKQHPIPLKFAHSFGGVAYERVVESPDWVLDYWHPLEKAQYPEYFKRREERKKEYVKWWEQQYGKVDPNDVHH